MICYLTNVPMRCPLARTGGIVLHCHHKVESLLLALKLGRQSATSIARIWNPLTTMRASHLTQGHTLKLERWHQIRSDGCHRGILARALHHPLIRRDLIRLSSISGNHHLSLSLSPLRLQGCVLLDRREGIPTLRLHSHLLLRFD